MGEGSRVAPRDPPPFGIPCMDHRTETSRQCPTRVDGADSLIAHEIAPATCQERQRRHYHKCYTCEHRNAVAINGQSGPKRAAIIDKIPPPNRVRLT